MESNKRVIVFDCDGTVLDTFLLIEKTIFLTFQEIFPDYHLSLEEAHSFFGPFLNDSFKKYTAHEEKINYCIERYRYYNNLLMPEYIKAYDGIKEMLQWLKQHQFKIAIVSNKVTEAIIYGLKLCNIEQYFDFIVGAEKLKHAKPDPDGIKQVQKHYHLTNMLFVGDTTIDMQTAQNSGIPSVGVTWCKSSKQQLINAGATYVINHPQDIYDIVEKYYDL